MRYLPLTVLLLVALLMPEVATAQVYMLPTPPPQVTAATAGWQVSGDPLFHAGALYYPAGATVFFDGDVMKRTGTYLGVPLFEDSTIEPFSIVYVPVARNLMRPYERRRDGDLAGTVGSRTPSFPVQRDIEVSAASRSSVDERAFSAEGAPLTGGEGRLAADAAPGMYLYSPGTPANAAAAPAPAAAPRHTAIESVPAPRSSDGMWIEFEGARWYLDGPAVTYDVDRFVPAGNYRGFPVYRSSEVPGNRIFVTVIPDGPIAPFAQR